jgi:hypothetical protein
MRKIPSPLPILLENNFLSRIFLFYYRVSESKKGLSGVLCGQRKGGPGRSPVREVYSP